MIWGTESCELCRVVFESCDQAVPSFRSTPFWPAGKRRKASASEKEGVVSRGAAKIARSVRCGRKMALGNEWICSECTIIEQRTKEAAHEYSGRCDRLKGLVVLFKGAAVVQGRFPGRSWRQEWLPSAKAGGLCLCSDTGRAQLLHYCRLLGGPLL